MPVSLKDVAEIAGVSMATVSRVINGKAEGQISLVMRDKIRRIADDMGYEPNRLARSLQSSKSKIIGVLIGRISNPYFAKILEITEEYAVGAGYQVISSSMLSPAPGLQDRFRGWPIDGVLMWATQDMVADTYFGGRAYNLPVVYMGHKRSDQADSVVLNLYGGTCQLMDHLIAKGYRKIAIAAPHMDMDSIFDEERPRAYRDACLSAGLDIRPIALRKYISSNEDMYGEKQRQMGFQAGIELAAMPEYDRPDAVFCYNDLIALGMREGLKRGGLRVPQDVAVAGCDGLEEGTFLSEALTTIDTPIMDIAREGMRMLINRISHGDALQQQTKTFNSTLRIGGTT
jgi:LacI family transcriptional regulator